MKCSNTAGIAVMAVAAIVLACGSEFPDGHLIDLSHAYSPDAIYWPTDERGFE